MYVIGTAGHVDHGKSTLVQALTGIDPDRLIEEKEREMTIDLGFAWLMLGEEEVGVIDVPGHGDFIENMLAGVGGIDLALFVIAADEGVMPQTREHLAILDLLEVSRGVVALTKIDVVDDPEWLELVTVEVNDILRGTALAGSPIVPVSARTGQGIDQLKNVLANNLQAIEPRADVGRPRLSIDRVFTLSGFGTVVTGTLIDGRLTSGAVIEIQPGRLSGRVRGLQTHKTKRDVVYPGSRVAINLTGIDREKLWRGQVVTTPNSLRETRLLDIEYRHLPGNDAPIKHNSEVKLFIGAADVLARARVIGQDEIVPGEAGWLQLALGSPVAVVRGDKLILRRPSPGVTLGGGRVLDPFPARRYRRLKADVVERFQTLAQGSPEELMIAALYRHGPLTLKDVVEKTGLENDVARSTMQTLQQSGLALQIGHQFVATSDWSKIQEQALSLLNRFHKENPYRLGMEREALRSRLKISKDVLNQLISTLSDAGLIVEKGTLLHLVGHAIRFSGEEERSIDALLKRLDREGVNSPGVKECKVMVGEPIYYALIETGKLRQLNDEVVYLMDTYQSLVSQLLEYLQQHEAVTASEIRDLLRTSRKYAIALLEHLDENQITRRVGDSRVLNQRRSISVK
ncbi:MAG: selenocysteine-specific translation elongation factor [Chloroflexota bacterium]|jgi:selenocysteine-specific elongation factor